MIKSHEKWRRFTSGFERFLPRRCDILNTGSSLTAQKYRIKSCRSICKVNVGTSHHHGRHGHCCDLTYRYANISSRLENMKRFTTLHEDEHSIAFIWLHIFLEGSFYLYEMTPSIPQVPFPWLNTKLQANLILRRLLPQNVYHISISFYIHLVD